MLCLACREAFEPEHHNRKYCTDCVPTGLSRNQHVAAIAKARSKIARREKIERGCDVCGYDRCGSALEWHHPNDDKEGPHPSTLAQTSWERYREEIDKCILVCANCHREIHERNEIC